jgi:hypothetical protein
MQLVASAPVPNPYFMTHGSCMPYNSNDSMKHFFVGKDTGEPDKDDVIACCNKTVLGHVPDCLKPGAGLKPWSVSKERCAARIQRAWRNANENPAHAVCRRRLMREFEELTSSS